MSLPRRALRADKEAAEMATDSFVVVANALLHL